MVFGGTRACSILVVWVLGIFADQVDFELDGIVSIR